MQIVIDIPDKVKEVFDRANIADVDCYVNDYDLLLGKAIKNCVVLPKGHGKLIDVKDLRLDIIAHKYSNSFCEEHNIDQSINVGMLNILLADAPTIIEADKEQTDEKD